VIDYKKLLMHHIASVNRREGISFVDSSRDLTTSENIAYLQAACEALDKSHFEQNVFENEILELRMELDVAPPHVNEETLVSLSSLADLEDFQWVGPQPS
jgi:hypothetical protein